MAGHDARITKRYRLGSEPFLRIAVVSDFHDGDWESALAAVRKEAPDLILMPGDTIERNDPERCPDTQRELQRWRGMSAWRIFMERALNLADDLAGGGRRRRLEHRDSGLLLIEGLAERAPVFVSVGNHEWYFEEEDLKRIEACGAKLLDNADTEAVAAGRKLRIGGLSTRYDLDWLRRFAAKDGEKILLCHHPELYPRLIRDEMGERFSLIVSGHVHGGQWRIFGRPLYGPGIGFFPKYGYGCFDGRLVVSAGMTNSTAFPRLWNPCELVIVELGAGHGDRN